MSNFIWKTSGDYKFTLAKFAVRKLAFSAAILLSHKFNSQNFNLQKVFEVKRKRKLF